MLKFVLFILSILPVAEKSQNVDSVYAGTWQSQNGNTLFVVSLWSEGNRILGHYKLVEYNNGIIGNAIYKSNKIYPSGFTFPYVISGLLPNSDQLSGSIDDNTISSTNQNYISGDVLMKLTQPTIIGCTNCTIQATWKVTRSKGLQYGEPIPFNIPTNIILTKVSNAINLD